MDLLAHHPQVRGVLCGHVHQEYDALHQGVRFLATPSTCIQFMPLSRDFSRITSYNVCYTKLLRHLNVYYSVIVLRKIQDDFIPVIANK